MSTIDEGLEVQIRTIEERYGKLLSEWIALLKESGITKHTDMVAMLKSQYGMPHGSAHRIALQACEADEVSMVTKAAGRDPHEVLVTVAQTTSSQCQTLTYQTASSSSGCLSVAVVLRPNTFSAGPHPFAVRRSLIECTPQPGVF